jgi:hypothetical protein
MVTRTPVKEKDPRMGITTQGRSTQGVKVMNLSGGDRLVAITAFEQDTGTSPGEKEKGEKPRKQKK